MSQAHLSDFFPVLAIVAVAGCAGADSALNTVDDYPQLRGLFPVGMYLAAERLADSWDSPAPTRIGRPLIETYRRKLEDLARHHVNVVAIENTSAIPVPVFREMLREGERAGILTWASENGLPADDRLEAWVRERQGVLRNERGLLAWAPFDEPLTEQMERWLRLKRLFETADPRHPVIPVTHGGPKGFETCSVAQAGDYYPIRVDRADPGSVSWFVSRYIATGRGKPFWFVQQAFEGEGRRMPTVAESSLTHLALAEGAKGIFYFIYDHLTDPIQTPTPLWEALRTSNLRLAAVGPELLDTAPDRTAGGIRVEGPARASVLRSPRGHALVIVCNPDIARAAEVAVRVDSGLVYDLYALADSRRDPPGASELRLALDPGAGAILFWGDPASYLRASARVLRRLSERDRLLASLRLLGAALDDVQRRLAELRRTIWSRAELKSLRNRYWGLAGRYLALESEFSSDQAAALRRDIEELARQVP